MPSRASHPDQQLLFTEMKDVVRSAILETNGDIKKVRDPRRKLAGYPENMRVDQAAAYLNCDEKKVRNLIDEGELDVIDISAAGATRRCLRVKRDSIASYETKAKSKALNSL